MGIYIYIYTYIYIYVHMDICGYIRLYVDVKLHLKASPLPPAVNIGLPWGSHGPVCRNGVVGDIDDPLAALVTELAIAAELQLVRRRPWASGAHGPLGIHAPQCILAALQSIWGTGRRS